MLGKKVRLTPVNITPKCALVHDGCRVKPVKRGNQWVNPARMAKTAPLRGHSGSGRLHSRCHEGQYLVMS